MTDENLSGVAPALDAETLPETPVTEPEAEEPESSTEQTDDEGQPKKLGGVAKRINELVAQREEANRRAQKLESMLEQVLTQRQPEQKVPEPVPQPQGEPKLEQFQTYEEYVAALADYKADQKIAQWEQKRQEAEAARQRQAQVQTFQQKVESFRAQTPDFDAVALNPALPVTDAMAEVINGSDNGPELLYQLGQNPAEAARIAALPPLMAAVELGKFAYRVSLPQPKRMTSAPPPVEPLTGGSGTRSVDPDKMSGDEWVAWRRQQLKR